MYVNVLCLAHVLCLVRVLYLVHVPCLAPALYCVHVLRVKLSQPFVLFLSGNWSMYCAFGPCLTFDTCLVFGPYVVLSPIVCLVPVLQLIYVLCLVSARSALLYLFSTQKKKIGTGAQQNLLRFKELDTQR